MVYSELVLKLIKTLPNFDCIDDEGNNLCHHLAVCGDDKLFKSLIQSHSPNWNNLLNQRNDEGQTPLHLAVKNNKHKLAQKYIKYGANQNILDIYGNTCLQLYPNQEGGSNKKIIKGKRII